MTAPVPVRYASVEDYELRTGVDVPIEEEPTVQQRLDDVSTLIELYLGPCAGPVATAYPDVLTTLTCVATQRSFTSGVGGAPVRSESVGSTSVSYATTAITPVLGWLTPAETDVLDALIAAACPSSRSPAGIGQVEAGWDREQSWAADVDIWVVGR
jgi:hypothetical protein